MAEPESFPEHSKKRKLALCQQFNCPVMPSRRDEHWSAFSPETWNRYRAIGVVVESHSSELEGDEISLRHWLFGPRGRTKSLAPELGFAHHATLLRSLPSAIFDDFSNLLPVLKGAGLLKSVLALAMPATYGAVHLSA